MKGIPLPVIFWISTALIFFVVYFYFLNRLLTGLKERHRVIWEGLGSPSFFVNNNIVNGWLVTQFILKREFRAIDDPEIRRTGNIVFIMFLLAACAALGTWYITGGQFKRYRVT